MNKATRTPHLAHRLLLDVVFVVVAMAIGFFIGWLFSVVIEISSRRSLIVSAVSISLCVGGGAYYRFKIARANIILRAAFISIIFIGLSWQTVHYYSGGSFLESLFSPWFVVLSLSLVSPVLIGARLAVSAQR